MKTVWKYPLSLDKTQVITMKRGAKIIAVQRQGSRQEDSMFIWCLVDTEQPNEERKFFLAGTGEHLNGDVLLEYVATIQFIREGFVIHLFEMKGS